MALTALCSGLARAVLWPLLAALVFLPDLALSQVLPEGRSWADIPRPEYAPLGIRAGGFNVYPRLRTEAAYDSNVFARASDERDDVVITVRPELEVQSDWSVHALGLSAFAESSIYPSIANEDHTDFGIGGSGTYEISSATQLSVDARYAFLHEDRGDIDTAFTADGPISLDRIDIRASLQHRFNRLQLGINAGFDRFDYDDGLLADNSVVDQDFRDRSQVSVEGIARYALSPVFGLYVSGAYKTTDHDFSPESVDFVEGVDLERDFDEIAVDGGIAVEITDTLYATLGAGYFSARFTDPSFQNENGVRVRADVLWNVTSLTTLRAGAARETQAAASPIAPIRVNTSVTFGMDHELLYNFILTADARYQLRDFDPIDRSDKEYAATIGGQYLLNTYARVRLAYNFQQRNSPIGVFDFTRHQVIARIDLTY
ncbi:MAG: outer membrane beta-barrel protein [Pseudomonadota bacterium]